MAYNPDKHHRRSIRLKDYDYNQPGSYFITICTHEKKCLFGEIIDYKMHLNDAGQIVEAVWSMLPQHFPGIELDAHVTMPNHFHSIITNVEAISHSKFSASDNPLTAQLSLFSEVIRAFKANATRQIRKRIIPSFNWQRDCYDHIIRNNHQLTLIRQYIVNNPAKWAEDSLYTKEGIVI